MQCTLCTCALYILSKIGAQIALQTCIIMHAYPYWIALIFRAKYKIASKRNTLSF